MRIPASFPLPVVTALTALLLLSCSGEEPSSDGAPSSADVPLATDAQRAEAQRLAKTHCGSCHRYPDPSLLDTTHWRTVLDNMAQRMGIYRNVDRESLIRRTDLRGVDTTRRFPVQPTLRPAAWDKIRAYYQTTAPDTLPSAPRSRPTQTGLPHFDARVPEQRFSPPMTLLTNLVSDDPLFFFSNYGPRSPSSLSMVSSSGNVVEEWTLADAPIRVIWENPRLYVLLVGPGPEPSEASAGSLVAVDGPDAPMRPLITGLKRPVDMARADLNGDGVKDFVFCEYGHAAGFLSYYESDGNGNYERRVLTAEPGATRVLIHDFNQDGTPDIGALMAQGDERFDVYTNDGNGHFTRHQKLRFPPVYGSTDIRLADFNSDGRTDLLYVNGDNADFSQTVKPYHGLRIFLADEHGAYEEAAFIPLPGAYSARAGDFDEDGDLDIAAISYFPDYRNNRDGGFVYLENTGDLTFERHIWPGAHKGRWITMDAGDLDGDQDLDLMLGSNIGFSPQHDTTGLFQRWVDDSPSFVFLENTIR